MANSKKEEQAKQFLAQKFIDDSNQDIMPFQPAGLDFKTPSRDYMVIPLEVLPCGNFYKPGTKISIRAAKVEEVQAYSVVDEKNPMDWVDKMNDILKSCVRVTLSNSLQGSYKDVKDSDRLYLIFMIRELTFPGGKNLSKEVTCPNCKHDFEIPYRATHSEDKPKTFVNFDMPEKIHKFYDEFEKVYNIKINDKNGNPVDYKLAPPTIGMQELLFGDVKEKLQLEKQPNISFLKIIPYQLYDRTSITAEGINAKEKEYRNIDMTTFQVLNKVVDNMKFGIKEIAMKCPECGEEVHTTMTFPEGVASIFVISDAIEQYFGQ